MIHFWINQLFTKPAFRNVPLDIGQESKRYRLAVRALLCLVHGGRHKTDTGRSFPVVLISRDAARGRKVEMTPGLKGQRVNGCGTGADKT